MKKNKNNEKISKEELENFLQWKRARQIQEYVETAVIKAIAKHDKNPNTETRRALFDSVWNVLAIHGAGNTFTNFKRRPQRRF